MRRAHDHRGAGPDRPLEVTGADGRLVASNEVYSPGLDGVARLAHAFTERTSERLMANGLDPAVLRQSVWA